MHRLGSLVLFVAFVIGFALELALPTANADEEETVYDVVATRQLEVLDGQIRVGLGNENSPGIWIGAPPKPGVNLGVHGNGLPMVIVTDGPIRNFGLGRVDGKNATPILVFRSDDIVKMVFGLDMVNPGKEPFLVHWSADGKKNLLIGNYCDAPSRACTN
jgi:hypothetical protein